MALDQDRDWPAPVEVSEEYVTFDLAGAVALESYRVAGHGNTAIADELSRQVEQLQIENQHLVVAGRGQRHVTDILKEQIESERRHHAWEKLTLYVGGLLVVLASTL